MDIAKAAAGKKAFDIVIIDLRKFPSVCDYFVVASATSTTQARAISDNIQKEMKEKGQRAWHVEGEREAAWVLLDYGDVVAHVFCDQTRKFYNLERLWSGAPQKEFKEARKERKKPAPRARKKKRKTSK